MYTCRWCNKTSKDNKFLVDSDVNWSICAICADSKFVIMNYLSFYIGCYGSDGTIPKCFWYGIKKYFPVSNDMISNDMISDEIIIYRGLENITLDQVDYQRKKTQCWTTDKSIARFYAGLEDNNGSGIILDMKITKTDPRILFWNCQKYANEMFESLTEYKRQKSKNPYAKNVIILTY